MYKIMELNPCSVEYNGGFKKRFKGVETFLRRVAFNLGNSPSQSEVKIISCIPIDVTDLQQKIVNLEKQLQSKKSGKTPSNSQSAVAVALYSPKFPDCNPNINKEEYIKESVNVEEYMKNMKINVDIIDQPETNSATHSQLCYRSDAIIERNVEADKPNTANSIIVSETTNKEIVKETMKKLDKKPQRKLGKNKDHLVCYAHTVAHFNTSTDASTLKETKLGITRDYLRNVVRKQYKPKVVEGNSDFSDFSSPICRDINETETSYSYDPDICSCCDGQFHNIDRDMASHSCNIDLSKVSDDLFYSTNTSQTKSRNTDSNVYYDSKFYDTVPVKQPKNIRENSLLNNTHSKNNFSVKPTMRSLLVNYYQTAKSSKPSKLYIPINKQPIKYHRKTLSKSASPKRGNFTHLDSNNSCCVECGDIYYKKRHIEGIRRNHCFHNECNKISANKRRKDFIKKDLACIAVKINNECQTVNMKDVQVEVSLPEENRTDLTLHQIKSLLQTVLTEVKMNAQIPKKDAVVQKETHLHVKRSSSLVQSNTCSPYDINPYAIPFSKTIGNHVCCPGNLLTNSRYMQNFPLFVQAAGRQMYDGCYRHGNVINKQAVNTSTNTDSETKVKHSKETEKLIREIYKSIAVDIPTRDTSNSEYEKTKPLIYDNSGKSNKSVSADEYATENVKVPNSQRKYVTAANLVIPSTPYESKTMSTSISTRTQMISTGDTNGIMRKGITENRKQLRNEKIETLLHKKELRSTETELVASNQVMAQRPNILVIASDDESEKSETAESDQSIVENAILEKQTLKKRGEKQGLLRKMLKSVKLFKSKEKKNYNVESKYEDSEASDSDDYETVYSKEVYPRQTIERYEPPKYPVHNYQKSYRKMSRFPYMEQEQRRHWNEELMYHSNNRRKYSSEKPYPRQSMRSNIPSVYGRNYETRSAFIDDPRSIRRPYSRDNINVNNEHGDNKTKNVKAKVVNQTVRGMSWLKKRKCGENWKKFILES